MDKPTWAHRAEYLLARALETGVSFLPEAAADRLASGLGTLAHGGVRIRRDVAEANLRRAFPDRDEAWIRKVARDAYRHLGREGAAMLRLSRMDRTALIERTEVHGWDALQEALSEGRGAIAVTGHFGNWEIWGAAIAARGIPFTAVARQQKNRLFDARLTAVRRRLGVETFGDDTAHRAVPRALRTGHVVAMVADQDARHAGVWVPFFGRPASTYRGPALFARRLGSPIFASAARRIPGTKRYEIVFERVPVPRTGDLEADVVRLTANLTARLEATIRKAPEQYFWFHKRWKTIPPTELPEPLLGTKALHEVAEKPLG